MRRIKIYMIIDGSGRDPDCESFEYVWSYDFLKKALREYGFEVRAHGWELLTEQEKQMMAESDARLAADAPNASPPKV